MLVVGLPKDNPRINNFGTALGTKKRHLLICPLHKLPRQRVVGAVLIETIHLRRQKGAPRATQNRWIISRFKCRCQRLNPPFSISLYLDVGYGDRSPENLVGHKETSRCYPSIPISHIIPHPNISHDLQHRPTMTNDDQRTNLVAEGLRKGFDVKEFLETLHGLGSTVSDSHLSHNLRVLSALFGEIHQKQIVKTYEHHQNIKKKRQKIIKTNKHLSLARRKWHLQYLQ